MSPAALKLDLHLITANGVWKVQDWRHGKHLAEWAGPYQAKLYIINNAAAIHASVDQEKHLALEQRPTLATESTRFACATLLSVLISSGAAQVRLDPVHA